jgi:hypothetical protein
VAFGLVCALVTRPLAAQEPGGVGGTVRDAAGPVYAATIALEREGRGTAAYTESARDGRFELRSLDAGRYTLRVTRLGYAELTRLITVVPGERTPVSVRLQPAAVALEGVSIEASRSRERARYEASAGVTLRTLSNEEIELVPGVAEADPLRAMVVLPGVVSTSDFSSAFNVRGGSQDQNLILLDGAPIFSPFHLGGFFSVFNSDMVERAELASGGFSARYGGRVSSVLTVTSDVGDGTFQVDGGVSLLAGRVAVSGGASPELRRALGLESLRWRVGARRSYFDQLLRPLFEFPYHLSDYQGVAEAAFGRSLLRVSAYTGSDDLELSRLDEEDFPLRVDWGWGNDVVGLVWEQDLGPGRWETTAAWSRFSSSLVFPDFEDTAFRSRIGEYRLRSALSWRLRPWLAVGAGTAFNRLSYDQLARTGGTDFRAGAGTGWLWGSFLQADWGPAGRWLVETGLRVDRWDPGLGPPDVELSPRLAIKRFFGGAHWAVSASAGRYTQYLHSLRDEDLPLGLDVWIIAGGDTPYVVSDQVQLGLEAHPTPAWTVSLEGYYRRFDGVVAYNAADDPNTDRDDVLRGVGRSWGTDLLIRREGEDVGGWLALSWLKSQRTFPDPLSPESPSPRVTYPPGFDRRLDLDLVLRFPVALGWRGGLRLNVGTGIPYTRPLGSYAEYQPPFLREDGRFQWIGDDDGDSRGGYAVVLEDRNRSRYPTYHRLDVSFRRDFTTSWGSLSPHVDFLNVYNQRNVLFYFYEFDRRPPVRSGISMFPLLPTIGVEVTFR